MKYVIYSAHGYWAQGRPCQNTAFTLNRREATEFPTREDAKRYITRRKTWLAADPAQRSGGPYTIEEVP